MVAVFWEIMHIGNGLCAFVAMQDNRKSEKR